MATRSAASRISSGLLHKVLTPTAEHAALRDMVRAFVAKEVGDLLSGGCERC